MPSSIVVTVGSASANSYVTEAAADTYFDDRLNASAWNDIDDDDDKARALIQAARRLEREELRVAGSCADQRDARSHGYAAWRSCLR